ncbi:unnamed protein product, partial [Ectocarpus sp. 12 AP-2014]
MKRSLSISMNPWEMWQCHRALHLLHIDRIVSLLPQHQLRAFRENPSGMEIAIGALSATLSFSSSSSSSPAPSPPGAANRGSGASSSSRAPLSAGRGGWITTPPAACAEKCREAATDEATNPPAAPDP